jgi:hypothetical protein
MKEATNYVLVLIAASVSALLMAMTLPQSTVIDNGGFTDGIASNLARANYGSELVSSVDWSKINQELMSPTF